jgi:hypothetical protein
LIYIQCEYGRTRHLHRLLCHDITNDHQNVYFLGDTLAEISMLSDSTISSPTLFLFQFTGLTGITFSGAPVVFNALMDGNHCPCTIGIPDLSMQSIRLFPTPQAMK